MKTIKVALVTVQIVGLALPAFADYSLILKNGRQLTVESYRENGGMISIYGLGGEIKIPKDEIERIEKATGQESTGLVIPKTQPVAPAPEPTLKPNIAPQALKPKEPSAAEKLAEARTKEQKQYEEKLVAVTEQLKQARDSYSQAARGNSGTEPFVFTTEESFRRHQEDLLSRLRDAQHNTGLAPDLGPVNLVTSSSDDGRARVTQFQAQQPTGPGGITDAPGYTPEQKAFSDMRQRIVQLQKERQRIIDDMKQKDFPISAAFSD
jgi:hypothetical protein